MAFDLDEQELRATKELNRANRRCKHLIENYNKEPKICDFFKTQVIYELCKKCEVKDKF